MLWTVNYGAGRVFVTGDGESWTAANNAAGPPALAATATRLPEPQAHVVAAGSSGSRLYALGQQLLWGFLMFSTAR